MARDIANGMMSEMRGHPGPTASGSAGVVDLLVQELADRVVAVLSEAGANGWITDPRVSAKLQKAEDKLERASRRMRDDDDDESHGATDRFPNLKYARPKYSNVDSVLKYIEREDDRDGIKLVIMNFND